jgi:hypothetical protein
MGEPQLRLHLADTALLGVCCTARAEEFEDG